MRQPEGPRRNHLAPLATLVLACALISACATQPAPQPATQNAEPEPPSVETTAPEEQEASPREAQPAQETRRGPCAWSRIRGVAKLLAIAETPPDQGTWEFFPGDDVVFHPAPEEASPGDEYKALLRRPMNGNCEDPELVLFGPV